MVAPYLLLLCLAFLDLAVAQNSATLQTIINDLNSLGATQMASLIQSSDSAFTGPLTSSNPRTLFVPENSAFSGVSIPDTDAMLLYHLITDGEWTVDKLGKIGNHSILTTALTGHSRDFLENGRPSVIAVGNPHADGQIEVYNQGASTLISQTKQNSNINILYYVINRIMDFPTNYPAAASVLTPQFQKTAQSAGYTDDVIGAMLGYTFFAFDDAAFNQDVGAHLADESAKSIFSNHVVLGKTLFYNDLLTQTVTLNSGNKLSFTVESDNFDITVHLGQSSTLISRSDLTTDNGVIHVLSGGTLWDLNPSGSGGTSSTGSGSSSSSNGGSTSASSSSGSTVTTVTTSGGTTLTINSSSLSASLFPTGLTSLPGLSTTASPPSSSSSSNSSSSNSSSSPSENQLSGESSTSSGSALSGGAIAGIVIGAIAVLVLAGIAFLIWKRQTRTSSDPQNLSQQSSGGGGWNPTLMISANPSTPQMTQIQQNSSVDPFSDSPQGRGNPAYGGIAPSVISGSGSGDSWSMGGQLTPVGISAAGVLNYTVRNGTTALPSSTDEVSDSSISSSFAARAAAAAAGAGGNSGKRPLLAAPALAQNSDSGVTNEQISDSVVDHLLERIAARIDRGPGGGGGGAGRETLPPSYGQ